jgi:hypothetical protein
MGLLVRLVDGERQIRPPQTMMNGPVIGRARDANLFAY